MAISVVLRSDLSIEEFEAILEKRLYDIVDRENISASILVIGLTQSLLCWLNHDSMSTIGSLELFEKFAAKFPHHKNKVEQMRSTEYHANTIYEYYEWLKLSVEYLGMDSIKAWEREELLEMSK